METESISLSVNFEWNWGREESTREGEDCCMRWRRFDVDCTVCDICSATTAFAEPSPPRASPCVAIGRHNGLLLFAVGSCRRRSIFSFLLFLTAAIYFFLLLTLYFIFSFLLFYFIFTFQKEKDKKNLEFFTKITNFFNEISKIPLVSKRNSNYPTFTS